MGGATAPARQNPFSRQHVAPEPQIQARPLPSQRAGSYQTTGAGAYGRGATPPGSSTGLSARDRLRRNFEDKGRSASPSNVPARMAEPVQRSNSTGADYEDRFMPSGTGNGPGGGMEKPFVAATAPWASNESQFTGAGYGGGPARNAAPRQGLPSGPGAGRRGPGLPSRPRGAF